MFLIISRDLIVPYVMEVIGLLGMIKGSQFEGIAFGMEEVKMYSIAGSDQTPDSRKKSQMGVCAIS